MERVKREQLATSIFWTTWLLGIVPLLAWWFFDRYADVARTVLPGWEIWSVRGLFVAWSVYSATSAAILAWSAGLVLGSLDDVVPDSGRFFQIIGMFVVNEAVVAILAFEGDFSAIRHLTPQLAAVAIAIWLLGMVASYRIGREKPVTPPQSAIAAAKAGG